MNWMQGNPVSMIQHLSVSSKLLPKRHLYFDIFAETYLDWPSNCTKKKKKESKYFYLDFLVLCLTDLPLEKVMSYPLGYKIKREFCLNGSNTKKWRCTETWHGPLRSLPNLLFTRYEADWYPQTIVNNALPTCRQKQFIKAYQQWSRTWVKLCSVEKC